MLWNCCINFVCLFSGTLYSTLYNFKMYCFIRNTLAFYAEAATTKVTRWCGFPTSPGRHDIQHNDIWHYDTQHEGLIYDTRPLRHSALQHYHFAECHHAECRVILVMLAYVERRYAERHYGEFRGALACPTFFTKKSLLMKWTPLVSK